MSSLTCYDCETKAECEIIRRFMDTIFNLGYFGPNAPKVYNAIIGFLPEYCYGFENKHTFKWDEEDE